MTTTETPIAGSQIAASQIIGDLWIPLLHAAATLVMTGVILTCQFVHYPLLAKVHPDNFHDYERAHMRRITPIVGPAMLIEALTALTLAIAPPPPIADRGLSWLLYAGLALVLVNAVSTATLQGPIHNRLAQTGHDTALVRCLVNTNLIRTAAWSIRGLLALVILALAASPP